MSKLSYEISIPQPCHEGWNKMQKTTCGAFCKSCQKEVIDFTNKSEAEIVDILSRSTGSVCGHISSAQLNRPLVKYEPEHGFFSLKKWMIAASVLLGARHANANADTSPKPVDLVTTDTVAHKDTIVNTVLATDTALILPEVVVNGHTVTVGVMAMEEKAESIDTIARRKSYTISGRVTDENDEPTPAASVFILGTKHGTITDWEGNYTLEIPDSLINVKEVSIMCSYVGYNDVVHTTGPRAKQIVNFKFSARDYVLDGVMVFERRTPVQKIKGFFRRIAYKFRALGN